MSTLTANTPPPPPPPPHPPPRASDAPTTPRRSHLERQPSHAARCRAGGPGRTPADGDQVGGGPKHEQEQEARPRGKVDPLPHGGPHALRTSGPGVLSNECGNVSG